MSRIFKDNVLSKTSLPVPGQDHEIEISFETVTPRMAQIWLESNSDDQRKVNKQSVKQYCAQMKKDMWVCDNGESIKFGKKGLIDGQHRLLSIIERDQPTVLMIMRNINDLHIKTFDMGKKRSLGDILTIHGVETIPGMNENTLASVANGLYVAKEYMKYTRKDSTSVRIDSMIKVKPTPLELYEFLMANPSIIERFKKLSKYKLPTMAKNVSLSPSLVGWFLCDVIDEDAADKILLTMQECVPQTADGKSCAAFKLFQYIQRQRAKKVTINKHEHPGLFLWALDHMLQDKLPSRVMISGAHLPGQGHEGSVKLKRYFSQLKDIA